MSMYYQEVRDRLKKLQELLDQLSIAHIPPGKEVTKIGFWEDSAGNIRYIKYYSGSELLFTLDFSSGGEASSETWSITRT